MNFPSSDFPRVGYFSRLVGIYTTARRPAHSALLLNKEAVHD